MGLGGSDYPAWSVLMLDRSPDMKNAGVEVDIGPTDPKQLASLPKGTSVQQLGAWTALSRVLLNLDETITKE